jgi:ABC-type transporter Mla subunit MlaD
LVARAGNKTHGAAVAKPPRLRYNLCVPITINDVDDLVRLLEQNPDWQARLARTLLNRQTLERLLQEDPALAETLRAALIGDQLERLIAAVQGLSAIVRQSTERSERQEVDLQELRRITSELVETSRQSVARIDALERTVAELVETSRQSVARIDALERTVAELVETSRQSVARIDALERTVAELVETSRQSVARLDRHEVELQELRRVTSELVETSRQSVARIDALERTVAELTEIVRQSVARLDTLEQIVAQSVERLAAAETLIAHSIRRLEALEELVQQVVRQLGELQSWQRGEAGNRDGERYQRSIRKQAWQLLNGGEGGETDEPHVEQKLRGWLIRNGQAIRPGPEANPVDADLIWWKGDRVAVIGVSVKVNGRDVRRAAKRAQTLRAVGVDAFPVVIGQEWATPEAQLHAQQEGVEWKVGDDFSDGLIEFRRIVLSE